MQTESQQTHTNAVRSTGLYTHPNYCSGVGLLVIANGRWTVRLADWLDSSLPCTSLGYARRSAGL
jgi:hypothetical protein